MSKNSTEQLNPAFVQMQGNVLSPTVSYPRSGQTQVFKSGSDSFIDKPLATGVSFTGPRKLP